MSWRERQTCQLKRQAGGQGRIKVMAVFFMIFSTLITIKLFDLQILRGNFYAALAVGQHELYQKLFPERGSIYVAEDNNGQRILFPLVTNQNLQMLYAVPAEIEQPEETAKKVFDIIGFPEEVDIKKVEAGLFADIATSTDSKLVEEIKAARREKWWEEQKTNEIKKLAEIFSKAGDPYEPVRHRLTDEQVAALQALAINGLYFKEETWRFYPEQGVGGQLFGFWGFDGDNRRGSYGLEGYFDSLLSGQMGEIRSERDAVGNLIAIGSSSLKEKVDGSSLVLTIDRVLQYQACQAITQAVAKYQAEAGSIIIMNPKTGAILAMCGAPDYDPDEYNKADNIKDYNIPGIFEAYEPGSIFKVITMAAALDAGKVGPNTTFEDKGSEVFGPYTIKNFNDKIYGVQTMTQVLENSINTGVIYAMRQATPKVFTQYVKDFGFGQLAGIELSSEVPGNISNLDKKGEIYAATASFGQGITVTPLQMVAAVSAIANGGKLMKPYIVSQIIDNEGSVENFSPQEVRQVISSKAAAMLAGMMVSVVENGHGQPAKVAGYRVAGKTGTAQVANKSGGYSTEVNTSFVGFAPFADPKFAMIVALVKPQKNKEATISAAPVFGEVAKFILQYYNVPYDAKTQ